MNIFKERAKAEGFKNPDDQVSNEVNTQIIEQVRNQVHDQVYDHVRKQVNDQVRVLEKYYKINNVETANERKNKCIY